MITSRVAHAYLWFYVFMHTETDYKMPDSHFYAIDDKYRFDITIPNSFRNIERSKNYRHKDFIYSLFYFLVVVVVVVGSTARQDYFIHFEPSQSLDVTKTEDPQNKPPGHP